VRFNTNPFVENMNILLKNKRISISSMGKNDEILINQITGEVRGTHVGTYKVVDPTKFIKLFTQNIGMILDLNRAGIRSLGVVAWAVQQKSINKDIVPLTQNTLKEFTKSYSEDGFCLATFKKGIAELIKAKILARHMDRGVYFINPSFIFNGDRIAFTKVIEKSKEQHSEKEKEIEHEQ